MRIKEVLGKYEIKVKIENMLRIMVLIRNVFWYLNYKYNLYLSLLMHLLNTQHLNAYLIFFF